MELQEEPIHVKPIDPSRLVVELHGACRDYTRVQSQLIFPVMGHGAERAAKFATPRGPCHVYRKWNDTLERIVSLRENSLLSN